MGDSAKDRKPIRERKVTSILNVLLETALGPIWDGNISSKVHRNHCVDVGLVARYEGYNFLTRKGVKYLCELGYLRP